MTDPDQAATGTYTHGYDQHTMNFIVSRRADDAAAFFLPYLRPGMRLLDVGCGPGTITVGLAAAVAPGEVLGVDREPSQIELARALAAEKGLANLRFEVGNAEEIPAAEESFDAAFEHTLLEHVTDPARVLREMYRVLRAGGIIGLADGDWTGAIVEPSSEAMKEAMALYERYWRSNGGDSRLGHRHRLLLREAGFTKIETTSRTKDFPPPADAAWFADHLLSAQFVEPVTRLGWADRATLVRYAQAWLDWSKNPDAVDTFVVFQSVGRREEPV
jgi:ubiquinone/menaquinone biosynthesis C-methylase UbiE